MAFRQVGVESYSPLPLPHLQLQQLHEQAQAHTQAIKDKNKDKDSREDGRKALDIRPIFLKTGVISQANGSAYIEMGNTKVICGVHGPRQTFRQQEFRELGMIECEFKYAPFATEQRRSFLRDATEREYSTIIQNALEQSVRVELFPKAVVEIFVTVLSSDGDPMSSSIICASAALADAGIELYDNVVACTAGVLNSKLIVDYVDSESKQLTSSVLLAYMPSLNEVTHLVMSGEAKLELVNEVIQVAIDGCSKISEVVQESLRKSVTAQKKRKINSS